MTRRVVVDTNILVALIDARDKWHRRADDILTALEKQNATLIYFDCVVSETITVLARRLEEQKRSGEFPHLLSSLLYQVPESAIDWLLPETRRLYPEVIDLVRQTNGVLNFHDALIAVGCREVGIEAIVTFDMDFQQVSWLTTISDPNHIRG